MTKSDSIPVMDRHVGIGTFCTNFSGTGGRIRKTADDFVVTEKISDKILPKISLESQGYPVFTLVKKSIDTYHTLQRIQDSHKMRLKALGLKDANALTQQYVCGTSKSNINRVPQKITDAKYSLHLVGFLSDAPLTKKDMLGNGFKIKISDVKDDSANLGEFDEYDSILNFYGHQRFGSTRAVSHLVGKAIVQKNFEKAVDLVLSYNSRYDSEERNEIRNSLRDKSSYHSVLKIMPKGMDVERAIIKDMISHDMQNPIRAIRASPLSLRRLFVEAYQSFIFNRTITAAFEAGEELFFPQEGDVCFDGQKNKLVKFESGMDHNRAKVAVPLVGYAYTKNNRFHYYISKILKEEEIQPKDFFVKELQEVSNEGGFRQSKIDCKDFAITEHNRVSFTLSRGSFATVVLREIIKPDDPILAGF